MSSTESPLSRKNSATAIAVRGARRRIDRTFVAGGDDGDRERAVAAERIFEEFAHLAAALADERDDDGVEVPRAGEHGEKGRFADAGAGEDADALPGADGREEIDDADAGAQGSRDPRAAHGGRRRGVDLDGRFALLQRPGGVDRNAEGVDDAALPARMRRETQGTLPRHPARRGWSAYRVRMP